MYWIPWTVHLYYLVSSMYIEQWLSKICIIHLLKMEQDSTNEVVRLITNMRISRFYSIIDRNLKMMKEPNLCKAWKEKYDNESEHRGDTMWPKQYKMEVHSQYQKSCILKTLECVVLRYISYQFNIWTIVVTPIEIGIFKDFYMKYVFWHKLVFPNYQPFYLNFHLLNYWLFFVQLSCHFYCL